MALTGRAFLGSWAFESIGWFALGEAYLRMTLEGAILFAFLLAGWDLVRALVAGLLVHTLLWFILYGGYAKISSVRERRRPLPRLLAFRARVVAQVKASSNFRAGLLYGSSGRDTMNEKSDVDLIVVPARPFPRGVFAVWALRASAVLHRMPLEASLIDLERDLAIRGHRRGTVLLKSGAGPQGSLREGALVAFSGIDGSGKTTVAKALLERLRRQGVRAEYFYGHRQYFRAGEGNVSAAIVFKGVWRHIGRSLTDLREHPRAALTLDLLTLADYVSVQLRLSRLLRPGTVVIADRYVADVIAYLRSLGPPRQSIEGLVSAVSFPPDLALWFRLDPAIAYARKREEDPDSLRGYEAAYGELAEKLGLKPINAGRPADEVTELAWNEIQRVLARAGG